MATLTNQHATYKLYIYIIDKTICRVQVIFLCQWFWLVGDRMCCLLHIFCQWYTLAKLLIQLEDLLTVIYCIYKMCVCSYKANAWMDRNYKSLVNISLHPHIKWLNWYMYVYVAVHLRQLNKIILSQKYSPGWRSCDLWIEVHSVYDVVSWYLPIS